MIKYVNKMANPPVLPTCWRHSQIDLEFVANPLHTMMATIEYQFYGIRETLMRTKWLLKLYRKRGSYPFSAECFASARETYCQVVFSVARAIVNLSMCSLKEG